MSWILFFIAVGFALWYRALYRDAEKSVNFWIKASEEWKTKFHELVASVTEKK